MRFTWLQSAYGDIWNKDILSLIDLKSFVFESVYILLPSSMADFVPCDRLQCGYQNWGHLNKASQSEDSKSTIKPEKYTALTNQIEVFSSYLEAWTESCNMIG